MSQATFFSAVLGEASNISDDFVDALKINQFSVDVVREWAQEQLRNPQLVMQLAIIGAMRGNNPKDAENINLVDGKSLSNFLMTHDFYLGGGQGAQNKLSLVRLSHAFAEPVALYLKRSYDSGKLTTKRFMGNRLPPYLEFMGAGAMEMPPNIRAEHRKFAENFSEAVQSSFREDLYDKMMGSAEPCVKFNMREVKLI